MVEHVGIEPMTSTLPVVILNSFLMCLLLNMYAFEVLSFFTESEKHHISDFYKSNSFIKM